MRMLIVSEGKHELGAARRDGLEEVDRQGALAALVRQLLPDVDFNQILYRKVNDPGVHQHLRPGKGGGFKQRALGWIRYADLEGWDAVILVLDQDGDKGRIKQLNEAQDDNAIPVRRAIGVAVREFDAWMLADEQALSQVLGYSVDKQRPPERIRQPKDLCQQLLHEAPKPMSQTEMYASLAAVIDLDKLIEGCPKGFKPFAQRVRASAKA